MIMATTMHKNGDSTVKHKGFNGFKIKHGDLTIRNWDSTWLMGIVMDVVISQISNMGMTMEMIMGMIMDTSGVGLCCFATSLSMVHLWIEYIGLVRWLCEATYNLVEVHIYI